MLEGIDGAGTTTQARLLRERLERRGFAVHVTAEPSKGSIGTLIRVLLKKVDSPPDPALMALLFAADRLDHLSREIEPMLGRGVWVVCDRYVWSSLVYQSLALPMEWVQDLNRHAKTPDLTILVDLQPELAAERLAREGRSREIFDHLEMQHRIRDGYVLLAEEPSAGLSMVVDGSPDPGTVSDMIEDCVFPSSSF